MQFIPGLLSCINLAIMLVLVHLLEELGCSRVLLMPYWFPYKPRNEGGECVELNFNFLIPTICITCSLVRSSCILHFAQTVHYSFTFSFTLPSYL